MGRPLRTASGDLVYGGQWFLTPFSVPVPMTHDPVAALATASPAKSLLTYPTAGRKFRISKFSCLVPGMIWPSTHLLCVTSTMRRTDNQETIGIRKFS